jgi:hypothetical protein
MSLRTSPPPKPPRPRSILYSIFQRVFWSKASRSKLCTPQVQLWNRPHISAFLSEHQSPHVHRWIVGLLPPMIPAPCKHCNGRYLTSKFHCTQCTNVIDFLFKVYSPALHLTCFWHISNPIDFFLAIQLPKAVPDLKKNIIPICKALEAIKISCIEGK